MFSAPNLTYVQRTKEIQDIKKSFIDIFTIDLDYLKVLRYSLIQKNLLRAVWEFFLEAGSTENHLG
jgi:hypothetical protein